jgi:hypothetical protein
MDPEYYRARAAEATRKARADLFNSHIYREIACCYERLAADSDQQNSHSTRIRTGLNQATSMRAALKSRSPRGYVSPF